MGGRTRAAATATTDLSHIGDFQFVAFVADVHVCKIEKCASEEEQKKEEEYGFDKGGWCCVSLVGGAGIWVGFEHGAHCDIGGVDHIGKGKVGGDVSMNACVASRGLSHSISV